MAFPQTVRWINEIKTRLVVMSGFLVPSGVILMWSGTTDNIPKGWFLCDGTNGTPNLRDRFIIGAGGKYSPGATGGAASVTPEVTAGTAKTGINVQQATASVSVGSSQTGIGIQNATLNVWTGAAGTGIGIQATTLDGNTLPNHAHGIAVGHGSGSGWGIFQRDYTPTGDNSTRSAGASWGHAHGVSDPGHAHAVGSNPHGHGITDPGHTHTVTTAAHGHVITDSGHSHTITTKAISVMNPYYALCLIQKQ